MPQSSHFRERGSNNKKELWPGPRHDLPARTPPQSRARTSGAKLRPREFSSISAHDREDNWKLRTELSAQERNGTSRKSALNATMAMPRNGKSNKKPLIKSENYLALEKAYKREKAKASKTMANFSRLQAINEALVEQASIDQRRAPLLNELNLAERAENWTSAAAIQYELDSIPATVTDKKLRERTIALASPPASTGRRPLNASSGMQTSTSPELVPPVQSISEIIATAWTGDPSSVTALDRALQHTCPSSVEAVWQGRVVIDMLRLGSASTCRGTVKGWRALSASVARLSADLAQAPRVLIWGGGLTSLSAGATNPKAVFDSHGQCRIAAERHAQRAAHCFGVDILLSPWGSAYINGSSKTVGSTDRSTNTISSSSSSSYYPNTVSSVGDGDDAVLCAMVNAGVLVQGLGSISAIAASVRERRQYPTLVVDYPDGCMPWECTASDGKERPAMPPLGFELCPSHKKLDVNSNAAGPVRPSQRSRRGGQKQRGVDKKAARTHKPVVAVDDFQEPRMQAEDATLLERTAAQIGLGNGASDWNRKAWVTAAALGAIITAGGCVWLIRKVYQRMRRDFTLSYGDDVKSTRAERRLRHKFRVAARTEYQNNEPEEQKHLRLDLPRSSLQMPSGNEHPTKNKTKKTRNSNSKQPPS